MTSLKALLSHPNLSPVLAALNSEGEETRIVGGAVRNILMQRPVADIDLATTALPEKTIVQAQKHGWRTIPTGIEHGTVTLLVNGQTYEVTTLRQDVNTDGRHAEVCFGRDFAADALRRDFTINALSLSRDGEIHDYAEGLADITARRVRFIGAAEQRIREDFLRILRFFRFSAAYAEGAFDADALSAIVRQRAHLSLLSKERISSELMKTLHQPRSAEAVSLMSRLDILPRLTGSIGNPARLARLIALYPSADALLRLAALCLFSPADVHHLRENLRLSNVDTDRLTNIAQASLPLHGLSAPPEKGRLREFLFDHGRDAALSALVLAHAQSADAPEAAHWCAAQAFLRDTPEPQLPFTGADLIARGLPPGRAIGNTLKKLQSLWIRAGFPRDPQQLAQLLDRALNEQD